MGARGGVGLTLLLMFAAAALAAAANTAWAADGAKPLGGPRALAVSVPPDPVPVKPGSDTHTLIRVVNPNDESVLVTITSRSLVFGDDGKVALGAGPDPRWQRLAPFPASELRIPAQGYRDVPLTVHVPAKLPADLYFIGFLVSPVPGQTGSIQVINQIGSFLTIDVPGPRERKLVGNLKLPRWVFGSHTDGTLALTNVGRASVSYWGETDTNSWPGGTLEQSRLPLSLIPVGLSRTIAVTGKPAWPIGLVTITTRITYPGVTEASTRELVFKKRVLVISIWVPIAVGGLLFAVILGWRLRRRSVRAARAAALAS